MNQPCTHANAEPTEHFKLKCKDCGEEFEPEVHSLPKTHPPSLAVALAVSLYYRATHDLAPLCEMTLEAATEHVETALACHGQDAQNMILGG